jgi:hypothetical protein
MWVWVLVLASIARGGTRADADLALYLTVSVVEVPCFSVVTWCVVYAGRTTEHVWGTYLLFYCTYPTLCGGKFPFFLLFFTRLCLFTWILVTAVLYILVCVIKQYSQLRSVYRLQNCASLTVCVCAHKPRFLIYQTLTQRFAGLAAFLIVFWGFLFILSVVPQ